jgi:PadR family transcriptional regulator, regulatory protein PadR
MAKESPDRLDLLQGTLDMLILRTLLFGSAHGHQIAKHIQRTTEDILQVEHGSLYPALHRLERKGWVSSKWELAKDRNREFKYYRLTAAGRKQLVAEESKWRKLTGAVARIMWPVEEI